ncbi:hypothetical protein ASC77_25210 [Nocardioides sp. Root1257]|nr:hypothetical protein ASC77_25210 [Nocardioides sp. Root1257]KRC53755.1 hypothetical protein ASE24_25000 [Nocardioides sp. Root224]
MAHPSWYRDADGETPTALPFDEDGDLMNGYDVLDGFRDARGTWIREPVNASYLATRMRGRRRGRSA